MATLVGPPFQGSDVFPNTDNSYGTLAMWQGSSSSASSSYLHAPPPAETGMSTSTAEVIDSTATATTPKYWLITGLIFLLALGLRLAYVLTVDVQHPIRTDAVKYLTIAINLFNENGYSLSREAPYIFAAEIYPGYPWLLTGLLTFANNFQLPMYESILVFQALLGALSALLVFRISLYVLPNLWACLPTLCFIFSPWMIISNGYVLTEAWFIFCSLLACWCFLYARQTNRLLLLFVSGMLFGFSALIRPALLLFPLLLIPLLFKPNKAHLPAFFAGFLLLIAPWQLAIQGGKSLVGSSFALGGYPDLVFKSQKWRGYPYREDPEFAEMGKSLKSAATIIYRRAQQEPARYLQWYLIGKPVMFWSGDPIAGAGNGYIYPVNYSILEQWPALKLAGELVKRSHPFLVAMAILALALPWLKSLSPMQLNGFYLCVALPVYFTAMHTLLAPLPRYSWPIHWSAYILAFSAIFYMAQFLKNKKSQR